jgi:hypothetical protein
LLILFRRDATRILAGDWWRIVTALFFQDGGLIGGLTNIATLFWIGNVVEQIRSRNYWLLVAIAGALVAEPYRKIASSSAALELGRDLLFVITSVNCPSQFRYAEQEAKLSMPFSLETVPYLIAQCRVCKLTYTVSFRQACVTPCESHC